MFEETNGTQTNPEVPTVEPVEAPTVPVEPTTEPTSETAPA